MVDEGRNGCCTYPRGFKCSYFTALVSLVVICGMACVRQAKPLAIVGAVFSFITFLLMAISSIWMGTSGECLYYDDDYYYSCRYNYCFYNDDDFNVCHALAIVTGLGSLVWIAPGIICSVLACKLGAPQGEQQQTHGGAAAHATPVDTEKGPTNVFAGAQTIVTETVNPDGSRRIEESTTNDQGQRIVKVRVEPPPPQAEAEIHYEPEN